MNNIILKNGEKENEDKTEVCFKQGGVYEEFRKLDAEKNVKRPRKQENPKKITKKTEGQRQGSKGQSCKGHGSRGSREEEEEIRYKLSKNSKIIKHSKTKNQAAVIPGKTHLVKKIKKIKEF